MWQTEILGITFIKIFYCFFIYCFIGWVWETMFVSVKEGKLANRGFLTGPVIPIYGVAATTMLIAFFNSFMKPYVTQEGVKSFVIIFVMGAVLASVVEYVTSYVMEKFFKVKLWDYSEFPLNIQGRVCLFPSLFWGLMAIVLVKGLHPLLLKRIERFPERPAEIVGYVIIGIFLFDLVSTIIATAELSKKITAIVKIKEGLGTLSRNYYDFSAKTKTGFKEKYGETTIGDVVEHAFDRVDATIAFMLQGMENKKKEYGKNIQQNIEKVDSVLAENKERNDRIFNEGKTRILKVLKGVRKFQQYTARRIRDAFPRIKYARGRGDAAMILDAYIEEEKEEHKKNGHEHDGKKRNKN